MISATRGASRCVRNVVLALVLAGGSLLTSCGTSKPPCDGGTCGAVQGCSGAGCDAGPVDAGEHCATGLADCDQDPANGCEARLDAPTSCGRCTNTCADGQACQAGACGACPAAKVLALDSVVMGQLPLGEGLLPPPSCEPTAVGFEELWSLTLTEPATVTLEVGGALDTVLFVRSSCGAATDLACNDDLSEYVFVSSVTVPLPRGTWFIGVKEWGNDGTGGPYSLSASTGGAGSCEFPTRLQPGLVTARDTRGGAGGASAVCLASEGGESFFQLEVPPGQRGTLTVTPTGTPIDLTTRVRAACADGACVASGQGATPQELVFGNPGPGTQRFIASVAATGPGSGTFEVLAALSPLVSSGYTESALGAACDDFSAEAAVLGATTSPSLEDDSTSAVLPLPAGFDFRFFGMPMSHFSVSSNGFAQLYPGSTGIPSSAYLSASMPSAAAPNALLAPLWGDLVGAGAQSAIRTRTRGVAPNRVFGLEWAEFAFGLAGVISPERIRFQVHFFETSNVVEFHYCAMALNGGSLARLTGQTAAVGLESSTGTEAVQHSYRMPQSVQGQTALRFTPRP